MIRRLGVSIASFAVVAACVAAAFSPHERGSPRAVEESAIISPVVSDAVLRAPSLTMHPLAGVYVLAERPSIEALHRDGWAPSIIAPQGQTFENVRSKNWQRPDDGPGLLTPNSAGDAARTTIDTKSIGLHDRRT